MMVAERGPGPATRRVLATLVAIVHTRVELAAVEFEEERLRVAALWRAATLALFLFGVGAVLVAAWIVLASPPPLRVAVLGALAALFVGAGALAGWRWRRLAAAKPMPFAATLAELRKDGAALTARSGS